MPPQINERVAVLETNHENTERRLEVVETGLVQHTDILTEIRKNTSYITGYIKGVEAQVSWFVKLFQNKTARNSTIGGGLVFVAGIIAALHELGLI